MINRYAKRPQVTNWKAALEDIRAARQGFNQDAGSMSDFEQMVFQREIKMECDAIFPAAAHAVINGEFEGAKQAYKDSQAAIDRARTKEINRFDSAKFNAELQNIQTRVNLTLQAPVNPLRAGDQPTSARLAAIYREAVQKDDLHAWRAVVEVFKGLQPTGDPQERIKINQLAKDAEDAEARLRDTPELAAARSAHQAALDNLGAKQQQLVDVSIELGQGDPRDPLAGSCWSKAYKTVEFPKVTGNGEAVGEVMIHDYDSPEVTGVYLNKI